MPNIKKNPRTTAAYSVKPDLSFDSTSKNITYSKVPLAKPCRTTEATANASELPVSDNKIPIPIPIGETMANVIT